jgi:hypothetical protein
MTTTTRKQYRIDELLAQGEQWFEPLDDETFAALVEAVKAHADGQLTAPVVISERGRLLDGHHRLMALAQLGRKVITEHDVRIDHTATDAESEALAAISYQFRRRQITGKEKAKLARDLMRRFGWSMGQVAKHLGVSRPAVSQWLAAYPDPSFIPPDKVTGIDGKDYTISPDPEPTTKRGRAQRDYSPVSVVEDYALQLGNPGWGQWVSQWALTAEGDERHNVAENLKAIAVSCAMLAEQLAGHDNAEPDGEAF